MGALIGKFVRAAKNGATEVEVWGDGNQEREFLYVGDAVDGIVCAAQTSREEVVNLGYGKAHTIRNISEVIKMAASFSGDIRYQEDRFVGVKKRLLDVSLASSKLNWTAKTNLEDGIKQTIDWYRENM